MKTVRVKNIIFNEGAPKICIPVTGTTEEHILNEFRLLTSDDFDLAELRIDFYEHGENIHAVISLLKKIRQYYNKPLLFTYRTKKEGGNFELPEEKYQELNICAIESGLIDMADIELSCSTDNINKLADTARKNDVKTVISHHNFKSTPSGKEIISILRKMQQHKGDISKVAFMPQTEEDVLALLSASLQIKKEGGHPTIAIAMGPLGIISRLSGELFGSCMTFASFSRTSAPGQISMSDTRKILDILHTQI